MFTVVIRDVKTDRIKGYLGGDHQTFVGRGVAARFPSVQAADKAVADCLRLNDERKLRHVNLTVDDGSGATI